MALTIRTPNTFEKWFTTFLSEKEIDMSEYCYDKDGEPLQIGDVCSAILSAPATEQVRIQSMLVKIDFANGNIYDYLAHLAKALDQSYKIGI